MDRFKLMATYESIVRLGGYTPAAKELGVTRAMVSKRVDSSAQYHMDSLFLGIREQLFKSFLTPSP